MATTPGERVQQHASVQGTHIMGLRSRTLPPPGPQAPALRVALLRGDGSAEAAAKEEDRDRIFEQRCLTHARRTQRLRAERVWAAVWLKHGRAAADNALRDLGLTLPDRVTA
jgi:hypothetical protein